MVLSIDRPISAPVSESIFADRKNQLFTTFFCRLKFRDKILGGIPKDPKLIEGWLRSKTGVTNEEEIRQMVIRTMQEQGHDVDAGASFEELIKASEQVAASKQTQGFKSDDTGLYIEDRIVKAMLRESVNILYAGVKGAFGPTNNPTKKGAKSFVAERVFVEPLKIYLNRDGRPVTAPDGIHLSIGHITGPQGPRSTLGYHEYVDRAEVSFYVRSLKNCVPGDDFADVWALSEENGLGTSRSMSFGKFDVMEWRSVG